METQKRKTRQQKNELDNFNQTVKVPPQARDLEKAVIGAILLEQSSFSRVTDILKQESFYVEAHGLVFKSCADLQRKGSPIDLLTVMQDLLAKELLSGMGGPYFLTQLTQEVSSSANIEAHAMIVQQKYVQRELIRLGSEMIQEAYSEAADVDSIMNKVEGEIFKIAHNNSVAAYQSSTDLALSNLQTIEALQNRTVDLTGVPTGFACLDRLTCGWQQPDLIIIAARPSVGKTAFALNLAVNAARANVGVGLFSLEMSAKQLASRAVSYIGQIDLDKISRGRMDSLQLQEYYKANEAFSKLNLLIDDSASINIHQLRTKCRQMVNKHKVGMVIIDYLQLMSGDAGKGNREQEISNISRGLKGMAKELGVPVIALSQMSRAIEGRKNQEPMLSDLRESGAIEQDADVVAFLSRDDYGMVEAEKDPTLVNKAWIKFAKHRNGTLEKLAFNTDLRTQSWKEIDFMGTNYKPLPKGEEMPF